MPYAQRVLKPVNKARTCDACGKPYLRRNLVESWETQNPGHRLGWTKRRLRICVPACGPASMARRVLMVVTQTVR